jgi:transposase InsO family protein
MQIVTTAGARYFVLFKDDFSGWTVAHFMKNKSEVESLFQAFVARVENETKRKVRVLRSDYGGEFIGKTFADWLAIKGIKHETSAPHSPEQNGVAERSNRTIMEPPRSLLHSKGIPLKLWDEAVNCAVYTINSILSRTESVTPYETWYGRKPDISHLRIFGSKMYIHIPDASRQKLDAKSLQCIFMGYCDT